MRLAIVFAALALAGCVSPEERAARSCLALGYSEGNSDFYNCEDRAMDRITVQDSVRNQQLIDLGVRLMQPPPRPWTATCHNWGFQTTCSGY